jgi:hypothetical protein
VLQRGRAFDRTTRAQCRARQLGEARGHVCRVEVAVLLGQRGEAGEIDEPERCLDAP